MEHLISGLIDLLDKNYHQKRINKTLKKLNLRTIIDIGAHRGEFLESMLSINQNFKIYSLEPQSNIFSLLKKKYKNKKNIHLFNVAISNKPGIKSLNINIKSSTSTFSEYNQNSYWKKIKDFILTGSNASSFINTERVKTFTLDNFFYKNRLNQIDLLKIDTEGHEYQVLEGSNIILKKNVKYILIEFHLSKIYKKYNKNKIENILRKNNFYLIKKFKFPFLTFEDRIYKKINQK
jgi:FkbM family methyltransferase